MSGLYSESYFKRLVRERTAKIRQLCVDDATERPPDHIYKEIAELHVKLDGCMKVLLDIRDHLMPAKKIEFPLKEYREEFKKALLTRLRKDVNSPRKIREELMRSLFAHSVFDGLRPCQLKLSPVLDVIYEAWDTRYKSREELEDHLVPALLRILDNERKSKERKRRRELREKEVKEEPAVKTVKTEESLTAAASSTAQSSAAATEGSAACPEFVVVYEDQSSNFEDDEDDFIVYEC